MNNEVYKQVNDLWKDKQANLNPIVTRFMKANLDFFRKANGTMSQLGSMDPDGKRTTKELYDTSKSPDPLLHKLDVLDSFDKQQNQNNDAGNYNSYN